MNIQVFCNNCGNKLEELPNIPLNQRQPCPTCKSLLRKHHISLVDSIEIHSNLSGKGKSPKQKKPFVEFKMGDNYSIIQQIWMNVVQLIDRRNNRYIKKLKTQLQVKLSEMLTSLYQIIGTEVLQKNKNVK